MACVFVCVEPSESVPFWRETNLAGAFLATWEPIEGRSWRMVFREWVSSRSCGRMQNRKSICLESETALLNLSNLLGLSSKKFTGFPVYLLLVIWSEYLLVASSNLCVNINLSRFLKHFPQKN